MRIIHFLKQVTTIAVGCFLALLGLCGVVVYLLSGQMVEGKVSPVEANAILTLPMMGRIIEGGQPETMLSLLDVETADRCIDLKKVKKAIQAATTDNRIRAIFLKLSYFQAGWAALEEIRMDLLAFKKAGKAVIAYGDTYSNRSYYLASVADEIVMHPSGRCNFNGLATTVYFYTKLLDTLSIKPYVYRVGKCKDFVEPFCLRKMSQESKEHIESYLSDIYSHFLEHISLSRDIAVTDLKTLAYNLSAILPSDALQAGLITKIDHETGAKQVVKEKYTKIASEKDAGFIDYSDYLLDKKVIASHKSNGKVRIAVITAEGTIVGGHNSGPDYLGSSNFVKNLTMVQKDDTIKAVILRINSPGGSAMDSNTMWRAIEELKPYKPVVASLSNVAASGGYYLAAPCHYVVAQPNTLTGCIGIGLVVPDFEPLMSNIGIERDVVKTTPSADLWNPRMACTDAESELIYRSLQDGYNDFVDKICKGRQMHIAQVKALADGRVYTGKRAVENGLVDALGGLDVAINKASALANLKEGYEIVYLPRPRSKLERLLRGMLHYTMGNVHIQKEIKAALLKDHPELQHLDNIRKQKGIQAMLPYAIDIV